MFFVDNDSSFNLLALHVCSAPYHVCTIKMMVTNYFTILSKYTIHREMCHSLIVITAVPMSAMFHAVHASDRRHFE